MIDSGSPGWWPMCRRRQCKRFPCARRSAAAGRVPGTIEGRRSARTSPPKLSGPARSCRYVPIRWSGAAMVRNLFGLPGQEQPTCRPALLPRPALRAGSIRVNRLFESSSSDLEFAGAVAERILLDAQFVENRQQEIRHGRVRRRHDMTVAPAACRKRHRRPPRAKDRDRAGFRCSCCCRRESANDPAACHRRPGSNGASR